MSNQIVKPAFEVTCIKQSPVLNFHFFIFLEMQLYRNLPVLSKHLSYFWLYHKCLLKIDYNAVIRAYFQNLFVLKFYGPVNPLVKRCQLS